MVCPLSVPQTDEPLGLTEIKFQIFRTLNFRQDPKALFGNLTFLRGQHARVITLKMRMGATCCVVGARCVWGCELLRVRDARVVTLKNRRKGCEMRRGATCCVGGARCVWVRDAHYNVISVLGVRDAYFFRGVRVTVPSSSTVPSV